MRGDHRRVRCENQYARYVAAEISMPGVILKANSVPDAADETKEQSQAGESVKFIASSGRARATPKSAVATASHVAVDCVARARALSDARCPLSIIHFMTASDT